MRGLISLKMPSLSTLPRDEATTPPVPVMDSADSELRRGQKLSAATEEA